jgi:hypothetical protein
VRSAREIRFRLRQEFANLRMLTARPPVVDVSAFPSPLPGLSNPAPVVARLTGTPFAQRVERAANSILEHKFPILGLEIDAGPEIHWRRDYVNVVETGTDYFRRIPYLDFSSAGDHKIIWELNRHQHLVLLAQAFRLTGRDPYLAEIVRELDSWSRENPPARGINWASALEVAFRALSWIWVYHLAGDRLPVRVRRDLLGNLALHARHLESNLSVYFSPNTHLLGEAVALYAVGRLFPAFPGAARWERMGGKIVQQELLHQVREDGSHFEQSAYYHVYALDLFQFHAALTGQFDYRLARMADYLEALMGPARRLPLLGDDDGGRVFHPYGARDAFGRATLATSAALSGNSKWLPYPHDLQEQAAWWLGDSVFDLAPGLPRQLPSQLFPDAGVAILNAGEVHLTVDAGPFGPWSGGHSHSDTLSVTLFWKNRELLIDPGTYTYVSSVEWRNRFRGSQAHNTVRVDGLDQATATGPFSWLGRPEPRILKWRTDEGRDDLDASWSSGGITHRRRVRFQKPDLIYILDEMSGPPGEHLLEQFWHFGDEEVEAISPYRFRMAGAVDLVLGEGSEIVQEDGWRSVAFGQKSPAIVLRVTRRAPLPARMFALIDLSGKSVKLDEAGFEGW